MQMKFSWSDNLLISDIRCFEINGYIALSEPINDQYESLQLNLINQYLWYLCMASRNMQKLSKKQDGH